MKLITAILAVCLIFTPVFAAPMPWKHFNDPAMLKANIRAGLGTCNDVAEVFYATFKTDAGIYLMYYDPLSGRIVFAYGTLQGKVLEVGTGYVDLKTEGAHNVIPPLFWQPYVRELHDNVCVLLYPKNA